MNPQRVAWGLFVLAAVLRLHNVWAAPVLAGFDGPYHAAYIGILHWEGRLPLADESWSTFHPPLYYALCAGVWELLPAGMGGRGVLLALRLVGVAAGLALGLAVWRSARLLFPDRPHLACWALLVALFLPMLVGPSSLIGNEVFTAALCAWAFEWLLRTLREPERAGPALALGVLSGLAVLGKFNALALLGSAGATLLGSEIRRLGWRPAALQASSLMGLAAVLVAAPYFVRNVVVHGAPILLEVDLSAEVMAPIGYGRARPWQSYASLAPDILLEPADRSDRAQSAVWPATFASVWFDLHGSLVRVQSEEGRRLAWLAFLFGAAWTLLALLGALALGRGRVRTAIPSGGLALGLLIGVSLAAYAFFTWKVASFSVLKGTLLAPGVAAFTIVTGLGCDQVFRRGLAAARGLVVMGVLFVSLVYATLWVGWIWPVRVSPAAFYIQAYNDAPTQRAFDFFVWGRAPGTRSEP